MRQIFRADPHERHFRHDGYVIVDLLSDDAIADLWSLYAAAFATKRDVVPYARELPYYISIFDRDAAHKREVDARISRHVERALADLLVDYEVFYSNFMIKFPGDGQIEAHQDFNFVDESQHTAFNLWCPLVDTTVRNGGLCVIPGSHRVFRTQRGPNLPKALTEYNDRLRRYAQPVPIARGRAAIFDHKLIHYSPPNATAEVRVAVQSVLKPREAPAIHYVFDPNGGRVKAHRIDKDFILENDLWNSRLDDRTLDHEQALVPFPSPREVTEGLVRLALGHAAARPGDGARRVFRDDRVQRTFDTNGFVTLPLLDAADVQQLTALFVETTGGTVQNTAYGMYIGLEDPDLARKRDVLARVSSIVLPKAREHFHHCKPHLGSFLVKAPGEGSYTYPHQDWTFVDTPLYRSMTVWIALVDVDESNGALGFVRGSHQFFDKPVGSPSPAFRTCSQGHEAILYEYLEFVPLKAGHAVVFDNRTIHGATPNLTHAPRIAVAVGMTPQEAQLYHYFLVPGSVDGSRRTLAKLKVDAAFFERNTVASLKTLFDAGRMPSDCDIEATFDDEFLPFSGEEIRQFCEQSGLRPNGRRLTEPRGAGPAAAAGSRVGRIWRAWFAARA
jgi:ectoine hydroxylase-related dioxygenase (phytanoyl-CoA dioxygenase family)